VAVSLWGAVGGLAAAIGPSLGSSIVEHLGWPWAFYINLPLGAVSLWFGAARLREAKSGRARRAHRRGRHAAADRRRRRAGDGDHPARFAALEPAGTGARWPLPARSPSAPSSPGRAQAEAPLVDLALFANRSYSAVNLATLAFGTAFAMMFFAFFGYMTHLAFQPAAGGPGRHARSADGGADRDRRRPHRGAHRPPAHPRHRLARVCGERPVAAAGARHRTGLPATHWLPGLFLSGIGVGMVLPSLSGAAVAGLPPAQYAVGSAVNQATRQLGSVLGVAITVLLVGHAQAR
jgi:hypothetical protein